MDLRVHDRDEELGLDLSQHDETVEKFDDSQAAVRPRLPGGSIHGQIGGDDGKNAFGTAHWDGAGDHPDLTASGVKVGARPDASVLG